MIVRYAYDLRPPAICGPPADDEQPIEEGTATGLVELLGTTSELFHKYADGAADGYRDALVEVLLQVEAIYFGDREEEITFPNGVQLFLTPAEEPAPTGKED